MSTALLILVATIIASLVALYTSPGLLERCMFRPYWLVRERQYHTLVTSGFVHADLPHLIFNMMTFWFFAFALERRIGGAAFAVLYFVALVLSDLGTYVKHRHDPRYASLGASGAIAAVLFANIVYFPTASLMILPIPVPIPAPLFAVLYLGYTWYSARHPHGRVNHDSHLGGALLGLAFVLVTDPGAYGALLRQVAD